MSAMLAEAGPIERAVATTILQHCAACPGRRGCEEEPEFIQQGLLPDQSNP